MPELTPLGFADILLTIAAGLVYVYVGRSLSRRAIAGEGKLAWTLFVQWWVGLGAISIGAGCVTFLQRLGLVDEAFMLTWLYVILLVLCYVLWCLLYYLFYLFTGNHRVLVPLTVYYAVYYLFLVYVVTARGPYYDTTEGAIAYRVESAPLLALATVVFLVVPHLIGAAGYLRLYFKVEEPTQRYRIGLISLTFITWFSSSLFGNLPFAGETLNKQPWWTVLTRGLGLLAAFTIFMAYRPPRWVRERYGVETIEETPRAAGVTTAGSRKRQ